MLQGRRQVDQAIEPLVVRRARAVEKLADRGLFRAGVLPPLPFEVEDLAVAVAELVVDHARKLAGASDKIRAAAATPVSSRSRTPRPTPARPDSTAPHGVGAHRRP